MHRYIVVRIESSSWRIWSLSIFGFPSLQSFYSLQWTFSQHFQIFVLLQRRVSFGKFLFYWDFFSPFLVSYSEPLLHGGTQADRWCQFTLLQIMILVFFPNLPPDDSLSDFGVAQICLCATQKSLPSKKNGFSQPFSCIGTKHTRTLNNWDLQAHAPHGCCISYNFEMAADLPA